jgi:putative ATP-binding cassette transporter
MDTISSQASSPAGPDAAGKAQERGESARRGPGPANGHRHVAAASAPKAQIDGKHPAQRQNGHAVAAPVAGPQPQADLKPPVETYAGTGAAREVLAMLKAIWTSAYCRRLWLLTAGIALVIGANMVGQVRLNDWRGDFFDALERTDVNAFGQQLLVFLVIVAVLLALVVGQTWLREMLKVRLRQWLTHHLLDEWLVPGRAYRLGLAGQIGVNPDQRIEEDARTLTELSVSLGVGLFQASLLLACFIGILWSLSDNVTFVIAGEPRVIPGYMVWCAIAYALAGSLLTWRVGSPLIGLNAERYAREADLRFALVRVSESAESIALYGGERDERRHLEGTLDHVILAMRGLSGALSRLTWITSGYGWFAIVVPVVVAAPGYFSGGLTLGGMMMVVGAFNQVQQSLRWFVDNFPAIADWRATLYRVSAFKASVANLDALDGGSGRIALADDPQGQLVFDHVSVQFADGRIVIAEAKAEIGVGERVLIVGESGIGKSTLFRAIAGLWPWGGGTIRLPPRGGMMFMPQRPYLPLADLHAAVAYPSAPVAFERATVEAALARVGLAEFLPLAATTERLDKNLSLGQQQLVAFARLLLHKPKWVFMDEATSALDEDSQRLALSIFERELADTTVLSIGHRPGLEAFHSRTLHLVRTPDGACLRPQQQAGHAEATAWAY